MTWLLLAGLTALFDSFKDVQSKRTVPFVDVYLVSWALFAPMLPVLVAYWITHRIPPLGDQFLFALMMGGILNAIAVLLYVLALSKGDLSLTVPLLTLSPVFLLVTSPWLVDEYPSPMDGLGVLLILLGSYILNLENTQDGYLKPFRAVLKAESSRLMLVVALLWSLTANFDKIGVLNSSPGFWVVALFSFIAITLLPIIALKSKQPLQQLQQHYPSLLMIGGLNSLAVFFQMQALQLNTVTRVIAIKRTSTLLGVFWGYWFFQETGIRKRASGAILMVLGVFVIMLA